MFTGIVQGLGEVLAVEPGAAAARLRICLPLGARGALAIGASVAIDGVCLTVVSGDPLDATFDVIGETLRVTTLGARRAGDRVNIERSARFGDEIGGHLISGHVSGTAVVHARHVHDDAVELRLRVDPGLVAYVLPKGFVGLDGCSLTVGPTVSEQGEFSVYLIPETLRVTTLGGRGPGDRLNIEIDSLTRAVVDTVARILSRPTA